jgi:hypothetical protein
MLYDPKDHYEPEETKQFFKENEKGFERLFRFKEWKLLQPFLKKSDKSAKSLKTVFSSFFNF